MPGSGKVRKQGPSAVALKSLRHDEATRKNIPTIENESLVAENLKTPIRVDYKRTSVLLYPRKQEADPQLVWRGKDQEDYDGDLVVKSLPIYVHEHITPQQIIRSLRDDTLGRNASPELFERDFNGLTEEQRLRFYEFDGHWTNRMILGDSVAVMASLAEKEALRGQVQMIFIDPPYGVEFKSNWQVAANKKDVRNGKITDVTAEPEQIKAYRDTWRDGIHSYLSYLRDRLTVTHDLLNDTGSVFVQISDDNMHLVRCLLDEVFGVGNFIAQITFKTTSGAGSFSGGTTTLASTADYLLWYSKDRERIKYRQLYRDKEPEGAGGGEYYRLLTADGDRMKVANATPDQLAKGRRFRADNLTSQTTREAKTTVFPVEVDGQTFLPSGSNGWKTNRVGMDRLKIANRLIATGTTLQYVRFLDDFPAFSINNVWDDALAGYNNEKRYVVQTSMKVIERCIQMTTDPGDLVLDPTCGGGTTAYCAEKWGRRWITIDTSRVALMLARENLMSAKLPYYLLADSHEGRLQEARLSGQPTPSDLPPAKGNVAKGFVLERVPRIGLKSIANNPDIAEGMSRDEIDSCIRRYAETTYFVDRPKLDKSAVRVAGPFTVESLAPTESTPLDEGPERSSPSVEQGDFVSLVIDNIRVSGIVNGDKGGRTQFVSVDRFPGEYVNAVGITDDGHRFAIAVGPKEGTVGPSYMRAAAREATSSALAETLAVCGFAFETAAQTERMGTVLVLKVRMNQDLQLGDLLKKSKGATLFRVYGEPDVQLHQNNGAYTVQVYGMDVYDPAKRDIRPAWKRRGRFEPVAAAGN
jgi:adenine-specific DNA-methyltransferase